MPCAYALMIITLTSQVSHLGTGPPPEVIFLS